MSAALIPTGNGWAWTEAEVERAKQLRRQGHTYASIAPILAAEFRTARSKLGVEKLFRRLRTGCQNVVRGKIVRAIPPDSYEGRILAIGAEKLTFMTQPEIAAAVGCHRSYIGRILRRSGLACTSRDPFDTAKARIIAMGAEKLATMTCRQITKAAGCSVHQTRRVLDDCGFDYVKLQGGRGPVKLEAVRSHLGKGLTARQIAERVGGTAGAVRNICYRIRQQDAAA